MKPLIIIYSSVLIGLYTVLAFSGVRPEVKAPGRRAALPELVVRTAQDKLPEATALGNKFDEVKISLAEKKERKAAQELYDGIMILAVRTVQGGKYEKNFFHETVDGLASNCVKLAANKPVNVKKLDRLFETAELFAAQNLIYQSNRNIERNDLPGALKDICAAEECIAAAIRYSDRNDREQDRRLFNSSRHLMQDVIGEMHTGLRSPWKQFKTKMNSVDSRLEGSVSI